METADAYISETIIRPTKVVGVWDKWHKFSLNLCSNHYLHILLLLCSLFTVSCSKSELFINKTPNPEVSILLKVDFMIVGELNNRVMTSSIVGGKDIETLNNVWLVATIKKGSHSTLLKQKLTAKGAHYETLLDRDVILNDSCRLYFIGNADLIPNFEAITTIDELCSAQFAEASKHAGVLLKRHIMITQTGIVPSETKNEIVIKGADMYCTTSLIQVEYMNKLVGIENITITGTTLYGTFQHIFNGGKAADNKTESIVITDNEPEMGGSNGKIGIKNYYINSNKNQPVAVNVGVAGQTHSIIFQEIKPGHSYAVAVRHGVLLGYRTENTVNYNNGLFSLPSEEVLLELTFEQGASFDSSVPWLEIKKSTTRSGSIITDTSMLRCLANTSMQARSGNVTIRSNNGEIEEFTFTQYGSDMNVSGIEFVKIPAGAFIMGSPVSELNRDDDETQHLVTLTKAFSMGKYEVTNAQFCLFLNATNTPSTGVSADGKLLFNTHVGKEIQYSAGVWTPVKGKENYPVVFVTWVGASEFASWAGGSLPSEAQWEYACRGDYTNKGSLRATKPFGVNSGYELTQSEAQFLWDYSYRQVDGEYIVSGVTAPTSAKKVGSYSSAVNSYGLSDMHGNVWEWCSDIYSPDYGNIKATNSVVDPTGAQVGSNRVMRGGSWYYYARCCRSAFRMSATEDTSSDNVGFRIIRQ